MPRMSSEFRIAVRIYEYNIRKESIWFGKLKESMKGDVSEQQLNSGLDRLHDLGIVSDEWEKIDNQWTKTYKITEDSKDLISSLARRPYIVEMDLHVRREVNALNEENAVNVAISELEDDYFTCFMKEDFRNIKVTKDIRIP